VTLLPTIGDCASAQVEPASVDDWEILVCLKLFSRRTVKIMLIQQSMSFHLCLKLWTAVTYTKHLVDSS